ncbi:hypothetical protein ACIBG8_16805 [Nonomuraea sp. NPDC050556]|uniref:hypothetical protein n=1 Tax=Nonomuraea sp. NPDC050556 TaxID=3364369 RepID=UPI00379AEE27
MAGPRRTRVDAGEPTTGLTRRNAATSVGTRPQGRVPVRALTRADAPPRTRDLARAATLGVVRVRRIVAAREPRIVAARARMGVPPLAHVRVRAQTLARVRGRVLTRVRGRALTRGLGRGPSSGAVPKGCRAPVACALTARRRSGDRDARRRVRPGRR